MDIKYDIETIRQTCWACPSQWEGKLKDGRMFYIRYRYGGLRFSVSEKSTNNVADAVNEETIYYEKVGADLDGVISLQEVRALLQLNGVVLS